MVSGRKPTILIEGKSFAEISKAHGISECALRQRWKPGITLGELLRKRQRGNPIHYVDGVTISELSKRYGIPYPTLYWRFKHGIKNITVAIRKKRG
jgi:transposase-like protein